MRVLILDLHELHAIRGLSSGDEVHVEKALFGFTTSYSEVYDLAGNPRVLKYIEDTGPSYHLIIIGNNTGAGLPKAQALDPSMRLRAIICWNDEPTRLDTAPYRALGYQHFVGRANLARYILEHPEIYAQNP